MEALILLRHEDAIRHADPALAVDMGLRAVQGVLREESDRPGPQRTELQGSRTQLKTGRGFEHSQHSSPIR